MSQFTVDIDTGGTFTDATVSDGKQVVALKVRTTPHDLTESFHNIIKTAAAQWKLSEVEFLKRVDTIRYSTTIGTNTIIQRNGPHIGLIILEKDMPIVKSLHPKSLLGSILDPVAQKVRGVQLEGDTVDQRAILNAVEGLLAEGAERLVVSISDHAEAVEPAIKRIVFSEYPRHVLGALPILFSTELTTDAGILRRITTAVLNAYLHPNLETFLYNAEDILRQYRYNRPLFIFCNDGMSNRVAKVTAIKTYNSGPTGGVEGALNFARHYGFPNVVTIDIGGTSTDLAFLVDGRLEEDVIGRIDGAEISFPLHRIEALGGGGGTIARVEQGRFRLGPDSAGASPGPACFGFGGTDATVTDANLVLGYFRHGTALAGQVPIDGDRALRAITTRVAEPLGITATEAAARIRDTLEDRIAEAIRKGVERRGVPRDNVVLIAFGGSGPMHAAGIAARAGIRKVLLPAMASVFSSFGIGFSDVVHRYTRTVCPVDSAGLQQVMDTLLERARIDMRGEGFSPNRVAFTWSVALLHGDHVVQTADVPEVALEQLQRRSDITAAVLELQARAHLPHLGLQEEPVRTGRPEPSGRRDVTWAAGKSVATSIYEFDILEQSDGTLDGPAIVEAPYTTLVIPPGWRLSRDQYRQYLLTQEGN
ncbi:MAG: hydantoinase/oxoprolinase family protein [Alicyclobacillaceae bacterium]|nr:hydantoinase/oxoprolinase family protein [Alicyclobacillaceae bacterium]